MRQHQRHKQHVAYRTPNVRTFRKGQYAITFAVALVMAVTAPFAVGKLNLNRLFADTTSEAAGALPDLVLNDIYLDGSTLTVEAGNNSSVAIPEDTAGSTYIYIDDVLTWTYSWTTLGDKSFLGPQGVSKIQPQTLTGEHKVGACVDANNVVTESNEDNNCLYVTLGSTGGDTGNYDDVGDGYCDNSLEWDVDCNDAVNQDQQDQQNNNYGTCPDGGTWVSQGGTAGYCMDDKNQQDQQDQQNQNNGTCSDGGIWVSQDGDNGYCMSQKDIDRSAKDAQKWLTEQTKGIERLVKDGQRWAKQVERDFTQQLKDLERMQDADADFIAKNQSTIEEAMGKVDDYLSELDKLSATAKSFLEGQKSLYETAQSTGDYSEFWNNTRGYDWVWWTNEALNTDLEHLQRREMYGNWLVQYEQLAAAYSNADETLPQEVTDMKSFMDDTINAADSAYNDVLTIKEEFQSASPSDLVASEDAYDSYASLHDDMQTAAQDMRDAFSEIDDAYPWDVFQGAWDNLNGAQQNQFITEQVDQIRTEIQDFIDGPLADAAAAGKDTTKLEKLADKGLEICDAIDTAVSDGAYDVVDNLFNKLDKLGSIAEREAAKLGMDLGGDKGSLVDTQAVQQDAFAQNYGLEGDAQDLLTTILQQVPQDVLQQYVGGETMQQLKDMLQAQADNGNVDFKLDSLMTVTGYIDEENATTMLDNKQTLVTAINDLDSNLDDYESLKPATQKSVENFLGDLAKPIFVGDGAVQAEGLVTKISDAVGQLDKGEITQTEFNTTLNDAKNSLGDLKEQNKTDQWKEAGIPKDVDPVDDWSAPYILEAQSVGAMTGDRDANGNLKGTFRPGDQLGVNEWIKMVTVAADIPTNSKTDNSSAQGDWSKTYVGGAENAGIENFGTEALGTVDVKQSATRAEAVSFAIDTLKASGYDMPEVTNPEKAFSDIGDLDPKLQEDIAIAKDLGLVSGNPDGTFAPNDVFQRDQAAKIVTKVMDVLNGKTDAAGTTTSIDVFIKEVDSDLNNIGNGTTTGTDNGNTVHSGAGNTEGDNTNIDNTGETYTNTGNGTQPEFNDEVPSI